MTVMGFIGWTIVLAAFGTLCSSCFSDRHRIGLAAAAIVPVAGFWISIEGMPLVGFLRAVLAEPSVALIAICACQGARYINFRQQEAGWQLGVMHVCILAVCVLIYPSGLGLGFTDLYALGYNPYTGLALYFAAVLAYVRPSSRLVSYWLVISLLAHGFGFGESNNIMDYLIDPIAVFCSLVFFARYALRRLCHAQ